MNRLSIDVTEEEKKQLKAAAALSGKTLKAYVLNKALPYTDDEQAALRELEKHLRPRIEQAERGEFSTKSFADIKKEAYSRLNNE